MGHPVERRRRVLVETQREAADAARRSRRSSSRGYRRDTFALWAAFFSCLLSVYLGFSWLPSILTSAGLGASVASTGITVFNLGGVVGAVGGGLLIAPLRLAADDARRSRRWRSPAPSC